MSQLELLPARSAPTSREAAHRAQAFAPAQRELVYAFIARRGVHGATQREISEGLGLGRPSVCARVYELEGRWASLPARIVRTTQRRAGCAVYVSVEA